MTGHDLGFQIIAIHLSVIMGKPPRTELVLSTYAKPQCALIEAILAWKVDHVRTEQLSQTMKQQVRDVVGIGVGEERILKTPAPFRCRTIFV